VGVNGTPETNFDIQSSMPRRAGRQQKRADPDV